MVCWVIGGNAWEGEGMGRCVGGVFARLIEGGGLQCGVGGQVVGGSVGLV
ncbi:hypothetical protein [Bartonella schoenbuchensis]